MQRIAAVCLPLAVLSLTPCVAQASPWWGDASLGILSTSGNSDTRSINSKLDVNYLQGPWNNAFVATAASAAANGQSTSENYLVTDKVDYTFLEKNYAFVGGDFQKDLFGGIRERTSETAGLGRHVLSGPVQTLDLELGAGARQEEEQGSRNKDNNLIADFGGDYQYKLSDTSHFREQVKVESGSSNTLSSSITELKVSIVGNLFATLTYTVQYNSEVDSGIKHTDTTTAVNISYTFGKKPA